MTLAELSKKVEHIESLLKTSQYIEAKNTAFELLENKEIYSEKEQVAKIYNFIGTVFAILSDYQKSLENYEIALRYHEEIDEKFGIASVLGNIGNVYIYILDYEKAIEYITKAQEIYESIDNVLGVAHSLGNLGLVHQNLQEYEQAIELFEKALALNEQLQHKFGLCYNLMNIACTYLSLSNFQVALDFFNKSLTIFEELRKKDGIAIILGYIGSLYLSMNDYESSLIYLTKSYNLAEEIDYKYQLMFCCEKFSELYEKQENIPLSFDYFKKYIQYKDEIHSEESKQKAELFDQRRKIEEDDKNRQVKLARFQEQEKLLHTILPFSIADRILQQESFIADYFDSVSVLFMDLVGFTPLSSIAPPKQLVYLLDTIFTKADAIIESFGLEKIKTIGDGYLAVANITIPIENHQKATAQAALALRSHFDTFSITIPEELGTTEWISQTDDFLIRIGIHTGEVVAGVIGKSKYTYDLWGDAVNVASRMESNSEPGKIHISEAFAQSISEYPEFSVVPRGEITIKGKGTMNTFWLEKAK